MLAVTSSLHICKVGQKVARFKASFGRIFGRSLEQCLGLNKTALKNVNLDNRGLESRP
jgi:hypothetical protein